MKGCTLWVTLWLFNIAMENGLPADAGNFAAASGTKAAEAAVPTEC